MKKNYFQLLWCALSFALLPIGEIAATTTSVTPASYLAAYNASLNGDTLLMETGAYYNIALPFPSAKTITLKSAKNAKPTIDFCITANNAALTNGGIIFDSLDITTSRSYFIDITNYKDISIIKFKNCVIHDVARCIMRSTTGPTGTIMDFVFDNCIIKNCGSGGYNFIWTKHAVKNLSVTNSTLYNYTNGESFFYPNQLYADNILTFKFENNTVYKWAKDATRAICNMSIGKYNAASTYSFKNNLITVPGVDGVAPKIIISTGGNLNAQNNLIVNYGTYAMTTPTSSTINDLTLAGLGMDNLTFPDTNLGNFTIYSNSPLAKASTTSGIIGDPRWLVNVTKTYLLTTGLATGVDAASGTVSILSGEMAENAEITITATKNFGFKFVKWVDEKDSTLSLNASYAFIMDKNKTVKAVFESVKIFKLNLIVKGAGTYGKVTISGNGVNGKYEDGARISLAANPNEVVKFSHWDNASTELTRVLYLTSDTTITANFYEASYIAGWDFVGGVNQSRPADYVTNKVKVPVLDMYSSANTSTPDVWRNNFVSDRQCASFWKNRTSPEQYYYFQTQISTAGYTNVSVKYAMRGSYYGNDTWNLLYSFDGVNFTKAYEHSLNMSNFVDYAVSIPSIAKKDTVYLRWAPNVTSPLHGSINDVDGTYISGIFVLADSILESDSIAPVLVSHIPSDNATKVSISGKILLTFNEMVQLSKDSCLLNGVILKGECSNTTVSFTYSALDYNTVYSFVIPKGNLKDKSNNSFAGDTILFKTVPKPNPAARKFDAIVAKDSTGNFLTVGEAIASAPANSNPFLIFIKEGYYKEHLQIDRSNIHLIGEGADKVILTDNRLCGATDDPDAAGLQQNCHVSIGSSVVVNGNDFFAEGISFENEWGVKKKAGPQALALYTAGDRVVLNNCKLRSYQDTYLSVYGRAASRHYIKNCRLEGAVDFIYGGGDVYFDSCSINIIRQTGAYITAPSHADGTKWGYIFMNTTIDAPVAGTIAYFGRPWGGGPKVSFVNTSLTKNMTIYDQGWFQKMSTIPVIFADYNTMDYTGKPVDLSKRTDYYYYNDRVTGALVEGNAKKSLTAEEVSQFTIQNVLAGTDGWKPTAAIEKISAPEVTSANDSVLNWKAVDYAICYAVLKDNKVLDFTTKPTYPITESGTYTVKSVSEFGGLGLPSNGITISPAVGIKSGKTSKLDIKAVGNRVIINADLTAKVSVYSMSGICLESFETKGLTNRRCDYKGAYLFKVMTDMDTKSKVLVFQ